MTAAGTQLSSFLTNRIQRIEVSATMAVSAEADKLRAKGVDLVDFGAGEPHFNTPEHIKEAAIAAIQREPPPTHPELYGDGRAGERVVAALTLLPGLR